MAVSAHLVNSAPPRKKKRPYRKSTLGCRNCKLRRVKCDETRPSCQKCKKFGVGCDYQNNGAELAVISEVVDEPSMSLTLSCSINETILDLINTSLRLSYAPYKERDLPLQLTISDLELLHRFQTRTIPAISIEATRVAYQTGIIRLVGQHPYLMHIVLTLTAMHDRYLQDDANSKMTGVTPLESFHWSQATAMFVQKLDMCMIDEDKDAVFASCAFMKGLTLGGIDATCAEESWPLNYDAPGPLDWIRQQDAVKCVFPLIFPLHPDSPFNEVMKRLSRSTINENPATGLDMVSPPMQKLYGIDQYSDSTNNPYHDAVLCMSSLLEINCSKTTLFEFFSFTADMHPDFKRLLGKRDPRALLLMAYWYAKVGPVVWHIERRAKLECESICLYLQRYHAYNDLLQELVSWPNSVYGTACTSSTSSASSFSTN